MNNYIVLKLTGGFFNLAMGIVSRNWKSYKKFRRTDYAHAVCILINRIET